MTDRTSLPPPYVHAIAGQPAVLALPPDNDASHDEPLPRYHPPLLPFQRLSGLLIPLFLLPLGILLLFTVAPASAMSSFGNLFKVNLPLASPHPFPRPLY